MEKCVMVFSSTTQFANIDKDCKTQKVEMEFRKLFGYFGEVKIHQWNVEWNEWIEVNEKNQPIYAHPLKFKFFKSPSQVLGNLSVESTAVLCCDMQERFRSAIQYFTEIAEVGNRVLKASQILSMPLIVTEQYPKGLLKTVSELDISHASHVIEKTKFSMCLPQVDEFLLQNSRVKNVVLFGVEAHVCVQQTALDLVRRGVQVHVVADATSSRSQSDRLLAFQRLRAAGAVITTSEAVLFQLIGDKQHDKFKEIQSLIRTLPPDTGLAMAPKSSI